jgi:hypothetical protein
MYQRFKHCESQICDRKSQELSNDTIFIADDEVYQKSDVGPKTTSSLGASGHALFQRKWMEADTSRLGSRAAFPQDPFSLQALVSYISSSFCTFAGRKLLGNTAQLAAFVLLSIAVANESNATMTRLDCKEQKAVCLH